MQVQGFDSLVNRLAQEVAGAQRQAAVVQQKLTSATRSLEQRTQELAEARDAVALLLATLDASQDGILAMGCFGRTMYFNARFVDIWGIPEDKVACLNDTALLALQMAQVKDPRRFLEIAESKRSHPGEERCDVVELADGRILECHVMPQRLRGRRLGLVTRFRDVTSRETIEMRPTRA